jgi:hypothetical protein
MLKTQQNFFFREDKETGIKRETVAVEVPQLEVADVLELLNDDEASNVHAWILDGINSQIVTAARKQVDDTADFVTGMALDEDKLDVSYLASLPKSTRGLGLTKEDWDNFVADYIEVMVNEIGKEPEKAEKAAQLLKGKFNAVKTNKQVIETLVTLLSQWFTTTTKAAEFGTIYEYLTGRADTLINEPQKDLSDFL